MLSELMLLASTCHVSLQYLKQYQFLVIDIDQLLFTYKMALRTSNNHKFGCGCSILIKLMYLIDIYLQFLQSHLNIMQVLHHCRSRTSFVFQIFLFFHFLMLVVIFCYVLSSVLDTLPSHTVILSSSR